MCEIVECRRKFCSHPDNGTPKYAFEDASNLADTVVKDMLSNKNVVVPGVEIVVVPKVVVGVVPVVGVVTDVVVPVVVISEVMISEVVISVVAPLVAFPGASYTISLTISSLSIVFIYFIFNLAMNGNIHLILGTHFVHHLSHVTSYQFKEEKTCHIPISFN